MKGVPRIGRGWAIIAVAAPLVALFGYVALRSGPLAPVRVTVASVEARPITPGLFGVGAVEARYTFKIGPIIAGRVKRIDVNVGDSVKAGQTLGEMDPVDLDKRILSQAAAQQRAEASLREAAARQAHAEIQAERYRKSFDAKATTEELAATKRQDLNIANAALAGAQQELARAAFDREALNAQSSNLRLVAPVDGLVALRDAEPGTTVVAGQTVIEMFDPASLWINARFDQINAAGLAAGLPARITLRSRGGQALSGRVLRIEPKADLVTEETLAKIVFDTTPDPLPPIGELAEVTIALPPAPPAPVISNAAIRRVGGALGVWKVRDGGIVFTPLTLGPGDLDGQVQALSGLSPGDRIVVHSEATLNARSRVTFAERLVSASP